MKTTIYPNIPLAKVIPSLVTCVVIAFLSTFLSDSATANQAKPKSKTPAQVEQALSTLLNSRDANIQLASYTGKQPSNNTNNVVAGQAPRGSVDHSQKSIAELVLAGLAITNSVKDELSSPVTVSEPTPPPRDYAVADIVSVEELNTATNDDVNSIIQSAEPIYSNTQETVFARVAVTAEALAAEDDALVTAVLVEDVSDQAVSDQAASEQAVLIADTSEFRPIEETLNSSNQLSEQISSNIIEPSEDALPVLPAPIVKKLNKEIELAATDNLDMSIAVKSAVMITEIAKTQVAEIEVVETEVTEIKVVETQVVETEVVETEVTEIKVVETEVVETEVTEIEVVETEVVETEVVETEVTEIEVVETEVVETEVTEIKFVETKFVETEVAEIAVVETEVAETEVVETEVTPTEILEDQAPTLLAKVSETYTATLQGGITDTQVTTSEKPQVADNVSANVNVAVRSEACPENFNQVSIPANGKLCQIFAANFPASMILFIPQTPEEVVQYYLASSSSFVEPKKIKQRTILKSTDNNTTLIISKDGGGTQVDILVKSPVS